MPEAEQVLAFLETLPIVSGLRAGERLELLDFQRQFVRSVYGPRDNSGNRRRGKPVDLAGAHV
jgi:phage terminase large subunit-like protein